MSRCKQCNIEILEPTERCPLCNSVLEKSEDLEAMYPQIHQKARAYHDIKSLQLSCHYH